MGMYWTTTVSAACSGVGVGEALVAVAVVWPGVGVGAAPVAVAVAWPGVGVGEALTVVVGVPPRYAAIALVHRAIGAGEQLVRIGPVVGKDRDTDADAKTQSVHRERRGDGLYDPLGDQPRLLATTVATQQHDELVPAEACHGINRAGGSLEPPRRLAQHEVAGRMAMDVIDWLETVEIYEQNREGSGVAARGGNGLLDTIVQERPVDESS